MAGFQIIYVKYGDAIKMIDVGDVRTHVLTSLEKNAYYNVTVAVRNSLFLGRSSSPRRQKTLEDAPICSPILKSTQVYNSTSVILIWTSLQNLKCTNGILRGYKVVYSSPGEGNEQVVLINDASAVTAAVSGLNVSTEYKFEVLGFTVKDGPLSNALYEKPLSFGRFPYFKYFYYFSTVLL